LDVLGEQLSVKADGREGERDKPGERAEAEQLHKEDRENDLLEAARHGQESTAQIVDRCRGDIPGGSDSNRDRKGDADDGGDHGHPDAFADALYNVAPATREIGRKERGDEARPARQTFPDSRPVHFRRAEREREIDNGAPSNEPAQPCALNQGRRPPPARQGSTGSHAHDVIPVQCAGSSYISPAMRSRSSCGWSGTVALSSTPSSSTLRIVAD